MATIKSEYYRLSGVTWDKYYFKTTADMVEGLNTSDYLSKTTTVAQQLVSQLSIKSTAIPLTVTRTNNSAGIYAGMIMERSTTSGVGSKPYGIGGYFKATNGSGVMTHTGLFGGRLVTDSIGEVVFAPAYNGGDPYTRTDFRLRAVSATVADVLLSGDIYTGVAQGTGTTGNKLSTESWVTSNTRSNTWVPTAAQVGARPAGNVPWGEISGKPSGILRQVDYKDGMMIVEVL